MNKMQGLNKALSLAISLILCFTAIYVKANTSAYAATQSNQIVNGDFSDGLTGYDVSANRTHNEAMSVINGVCYIPTVTSTVSNDKPYNRWLNQKLILRNGKYIFSYDLDITYTTASAWSFAHAVRNAENMDTPIIRPTSGSTYTGITVGTPTVEQIEYVLNTNDATTAAPLNSFALSNVSKYYNYNGSAGRQVGRVSFVVEVNNTSAPATTLYFSIGNYANACGAAYIDNISLTAFDSDSVISNGDFEEGKKGYLYADDDSSQIKIYDNDDTTRPGYGSVDLDGKAVFLPGGGSQSQSYKSYHLQYKMENLPAGQYTISMDVIFNMIDKNAWCPLAFGITNGLDSNGVAYGNRIINSSGQSNATTFTDYFVDIIENGVNIIPDKSHICHRLTGSVLLSGWHDLNLKITFKTTTAKNLYFFIFCGGDGTEEGMQGTAYVDNISLFESSIMNYHCINLKSGTIARSNTTHYEKIGSIVSKAGPVIANYNYMGYKLNLKDKLVCSNVYETKASEDTNVYFLYAMKGDMNNDLYINAIDLAALTRQLLGINTECNMTGAQVNNDDVIDIRDLVALKKKIIYGLGNVMILGDSYSTFYDYIPYGYPHYYGGGRTSTDVRNVEETWWYQVIEKTTSNLVVNDSWSGSTVCHKGLNNTDTSETSSFVYRLNKYISEGFFNKNSIDTVFIFGGTNDYYSNPEIGELQISDWKKEDLFKFEPAICYILNKLKELLPDANIVYIINSDLSSEISEAIVEACEHYFVTYIQLENIDKVAGHPTITGMQQIKNSILDII